MAKTNKIARYVKEPPVLERPTSRGNQSKPAVLYLVELRSHHAEAHTAVPKRKLVINLDPADGTEAAPKPIKINHA